MSAPLAISSDSINTAMLLPMFSAPSIMPTFFIHSCKCRPVLIVHLFVANVSITLRNALFDIINSFPASPLRVTESFHFFINLNVSMEKCVFFQHYSCVWSFTTCFSFCSANENILSLNENVKNIYIS